MDCGSILADVPAYHSGDLDSERAIVVGEHLVHCDRCRRESRDALSAIALLESIEEIAPSERVWRSLEREVGAVARGRARSFRPLLRLAAAASVVAAIASFVFVAVTARSGHAATISHVAPDGSDLRPGLNLKTGEEFRAPTYVVLTLPDIGLLKLNRDTRVRFERPDRVRLLQGELFAEVRRGFVVESPDAAVHVQGTRFGVRSGAEPSTVYVVDGRVEVRSTGGRVQLDGGRMTVVGGTPGPLQEEALEWIAPHERVLLTLDARPGRIVRSGDPAVWRLAFRTTSPAPFHLEPLRELPAQLSLEIVNPEGRQYVTRLDGASIGGDEARHSVNGLLRIDVMTPCLLSYRVEPSLFPSAGRYSVTLAYQGRLGLLRSDPVAIEVR